MTQAKVALRAPKRMGSDPVLRTLLANVVDFAGLFPPAGLEMAQAVDRFASYLRSEHRWMLGRFVLPASRLRELERAFALATETEQWWISCLLGPNIASDLAEIKRFRSRHGKDRVIVDCLELSAPVIEHLPQIRNQLPAGHSIYFEVPLQAHKELLLAIRNSAAGAKIRTGGLKPETIPAASGIAAFLKLCAETRTRLKATAGLHHPLRCVKPLAYDVEAPRAKMHGFLNVLLAAGLAYRGAGERDILSALEADSRDAFRFDRESVRFGGSSLSISEIAEMRKNFMTSFGSCSFEEPVNDLRELQLL
jgi:hypothetical protein